MKLNTDKKPEALHEVKHTCRPESKKKWNESHLVLFANIDKKELSKNP